MELIINLIIKIKTTIKIFLVFYIFLVVFLFIFQRKVQYFPYGKMDARFLGQCCSQEMLTTQDGQRILSFYKKPQAGQKVILYFHGNGGNLSGRSGRMKAFVEKGFGVLIISYRGYLGSTGSPSQQGLMLDARAALDFLFDQGYDYRDIILFGESMGSGVSVQLAAQHDFAAMILDSPFASITEVAQQIYWYLPVKWMLKDRFESINVASKVNTPTLVVHGTKDEVVPFAQGQKLFAAIAARKKFVTIVGASHVSASGEFLVQNIQEFMR